MSVTLYDKALLSKFQAWTENTNIHVFDSTGNPKRVFEVIADDSKDNPIQLPVISISRPDGYRLGNTNKVPMSSNGKKLNADEEKVVTLNAIPIEIEYNIDVFTRYREEGDAYMREIVFNLINYPNLKITLPYMDTNYEHISNVTINSSINQVYDVRLNPDQISQIRCRVSISDAYLWDVRSRHTVTIGDGLLIDIISSETDEVIEEVDVSDV